MNPSPEELVKHLNSHYPNGTYFSTYEAGFCGFGTHRMLTKLGVVNQVTHAADVPTTNKEKVYRRDRVDSRKLARELEKGELNAIYVPDPGDQQLRALCRLRSKCAQQITRLKNRIKGYLYYFGIELSEEQTSRRWSANFIRELERCSDQPGADSTCLKFLLEELNQHRHRSCEVTRELRSFCANSKYADTIRLLRTIPGIGFVAAVTIATEVIDINRFKKLDNLCTFVGLVPTTDSSGETERVGRLTPRKNGYLKHFIIEAAWIAVRKDPALFKTFNTLSRRMRKNEAIIRIARKLLNRIRYVWKNQTAYTPCVSN